MKAKSIKGKSTKEIDAALHECISDGYLPTLAIVFLSIKQNIGAICELLANNEIAIYGATTNGEISDGETTEGAITILLLDLDPDNFAIFLEDYQTENPAQASQKIAAQALKRFSNPLFLIECSHFMTNYGLLLQGFSDVVGDHVEVFGGVAGDDLINGPEQWVFTNTKSGKQSILALALDAEKVLVRGKVVSGWKPVGTERTVTKSKGNRIIEIDGVAALDKTLKYGGISDSELPEDSSEATILVSRTLSMQFQRESGDPITLIGAILDDDRSLFLHGDIPEGSKFRFALPPDFEVVDEVVKKCEELKYIIPQGDAVIIHSCSGRFDVLGPIVKDEVREIHRIWNAPMAGFFCNGEIGRPDNGNLEIHNLTVCCVVIKEI
jgi:hypothetical protein